MENYIIIYNSETDFLVCSSKKVAEKEIALLIQGGECENEITVYKAELLEFDVKRTDISVSIS